MRNRTRVALIAGAVGAAVAAGTGVATAGAEEQEVAITGPALQRATEAALGEVPGRVTDTEVDDEEGKYEVEVTRPDGSEVDVHLSESFRVLSVEGA